MDRGTIITGIKIAPAAAALLVTTSLLLAACGGGGGGSSPAPAPVVTPTPTAAPTATGTTAAQAAAYVCPTTGTTGTAASVARDSAAGGVRRMPGAVAKTQTAPANTLLAVTYSRPTLSGNLPLVAAREAAAGATLVHTADYPTQNISMRVLSVPTAKLAATEASMRTQAGVTAIGVTGERRFRATTTANLTNDPYFTGEGDGYHNLPYYETEDSSGQWDMHVIGLDHAFGYFNPPTGGQNYTPLTGALGLSSIRIAIIDTGEDASHPELTSKIHYQKCFITNTVGTQSTGSFSTDADGHGTDVSGIAAAYGGNSLGFVGAGGQSTILAYRVFPTPDDNCANSTNDDNQCSSSTADIAAAIDDAVAQGANVISMSLGGGSCSAGVDSDNLEQAAVANALSHHVIVVAAAGNAGGASLDAPACIANVIAVGATALYDGNATGTTAFSSTIALTGTAAKPVEYVPSYSQYGTPNITNNASSWGIVAPGGDPSSAEGNANTPVDYLHWIENIWTSTPFIGSVGDQNFLGNCKADYNGIYTPPLSSTPDCRTLIAGTSMSTPHVAGAAALILAASGGNMSKYQDSFKMLQLLCTYADEIHDMHEGCGRLNVYRAMAFIAQDTAPPTPAP